MIAKQFLNEYVRSISEDVRNLKIQIDAALLEWSNVKKDIINDTTITSDGRDAAEVEQLAGSEIHSLMDVLLSVQSVLDQTRVKEVIAKPCVRAPRR